MVVLFCKMFPKLLQMLLFRTREMNEPMLVNQAKFLPSNHTDRAVHLFTALSQSIVNIC